MKDWGDHVALEQVDAFVGFDDDPRDQAAPWGGGRGLPTCDPQYPEKET